MPKRKRPGDPYQVPPHIARAQRIAADRRSWKPRPLIPQRRQLFGILAVSVMCAGLSLALWIPPHSLVRDLRKDGVTVAAKVTEVDNKPKYVKVEFLHGTRSGTRTKLWDYAGMIPDVHPGDALLVTYDPNNPHRSLPHAWVTDPPVNLPAYGISAITVFMLTGTVAGVLRRRRLLRAPVTRSSPPEPA